MNAPIKHAATKDKTLLARPDRSQSITAFLESIGWEKATRDFLAGDASFRRYERVRHEDNIRVLMDAPPPWEDVRPFVRITQILRELSLSAPRIDAQDATQGFLLLEDLGDAAFSKVLAKDNTLEETLYFSAIDALVLLQTRTKQTSAHYEVAPYDTAVYLKEVALFSDWFLPQIVGHTEAQALREEFLGLWQQVLEKTALEQSVLVHRDYHADNLLWLPERDSIQKVGLLDYQDALWGDPFYDVVSLLEDARRDVSGAVRQACYNRFCAKTAQEDSKVAHQRYCVLAAQRNMKIIGIFTRLCVRDGKAHYLRYLPRVWAHTLSDLSHPSLSALQHFIELHVPEDARGEIPIDTAIGSL